MAIVKDEVMGFFETNKDHSKHTHRKKSRKYLEDKIIKHIKTSLIVLKNLIHGKFN